MNEVVKRIREIIHQQNENLDGITCQIPNENPDLNNHIENSLHEESP